MTLEGEDGPVERFTTLDGLVSGSDDIAVTYLTSARFAGRCEAAAMLRS